MGHSLSTLYRGGQQNFYWTPNQNVAGTNCVRSQPFLDYMRKCDSFSQVFRELGYATPTDLREALGFEKLPADAKNEDGDEIWPIVDEKIMRLLKKCWEKEKKNGGGKVDRMFNNISSEQTHNRGGTASSSSMMPTKNDKKREKGKERARDDDLNCWKETYTQDAIEENQYHPYGDERQNHGNTSTFSSMDQTAGHHLNNPYGDGYEDEPEDMRSSAPAKNSVLAESLSRARGGKKTAPFQQAYISSSSQYYEPNSDSNHGSKDTVLDRTTRKASTHRPLHGTSKSASSLAQREEADVYASPSSLAGKKRSEYPQNHNSNSPHASTSTSPLAAASRGDGRQPSSREGVEREASKGRRRSSRMTTRTSSMVTPPNHQSGPFPSMLTTPPATPTAKEHELASLIRERESMIHNRLHQLNAEFDSLKFGTLSIEDLEHAALLREEEDRVAREGRMGS